MLSLFENTNRAVTVHILHDNTLSADNRDKFSYIAGMYSQTVKFYNVEKLCADRIAEFRAVIGSVEQSVFSLATMYRFLTTELFYEVTNKIIYLDSDTIINLDIQELWQIELGDKPFAAVTEFDNGVPKTWMPICMEGVVKYEDNFNVGVMLMNLNLLHEQTETIKKGIGFIAENPKFPYFDQDALNYCFSKIYLKLPLKFNHTVRYFRWNNEKIIKKEIYHYNAHVLELNISDESNRLFWKYFAKTPWFNEDALGHLYEGFRKIYIEQKNFATQISALVSGKTRAFFVQPNMVDAARQIFYVKPEEEIIAADSPESLQKLIDAMKKSGGAKVFFVLVGNYLAAAQPLVQAGFVEGKDFLNAMLFLSDAHGVPLNSYSLVKLL